MMCPIYIYKLVANKIEPLSVKVGVHHALQFCKGAIRQPPHFRVHIRQGALFGGCIFIRQVNFIQVKTFVLCDYLLPFPAQGG